MNPNFRIQLVQLTGGQKLMRIEDPATGLSVERKLAPELPLVAQKNKLVRLFETLLLNDTAVA